MNDKLDRITDVAKTARAFEYHLEEYRDADRVYRTLARHMIGTCHMGSGPETSVVNKWNQSWERSDLFMLDASVLATGGVVNPISALALRAAGCIGDNFAELTALSVAIHRRSARTTLNPLHIKLKVKNP